MRNYLGESKKNRCFLRPASIFCSEWHEIIRTAGKWRPFRLIYCSIPPLFQNRESAMRVGQWRAAEPASSATGAVAWLASSSASLHDHVRRMQPFKVAVNQDRIFQDHNDLFWKGIVDDRKRGIRVVGGKAVVALIPHFNRQN